MIKTCMVLLLSCTVLPAQLVKVPEEGGEVPAGELQHSTEEYPVQTSELSEPIEPDLEGGELQPEVSGIVPVPATPTATQIPLKGSEAVRLQIFLDQEHFGPGFIDGKPGMFTRLAIENYNASLGREKEDLRVVAESAEAVSELYATAIIPGFAIDYVDWTLPNKKSLQAERTFMPYRSVAEFMAERYHTSEDLLIELNGLDAVRNAKARSVLKVPNIEPFKIEALKTGKSHKQDENLSARHVVVDTGVKQVYVYRLVIPENTESVTSPTNPGEEAVTVKPRTPTPVLIASFPITPGKTQFIPKGFWNLKNCVELPEWRYDQLLLDTGVRGKDYLTIPPGPNNPVGIIWNGLTKAGIGIHGTDNPRTIGRARSSGCIRLSNWDAARIPELVRPGAVVVVK